MTCVRHRCYSQALLPLIQAHRRIPSGVFGYAPIDLVGERRFRPDR